LPSSRATACSKSAAAPASPLRSSASVSTAAACSFAGVLASAVVFGELRLRTGSIWPGVVLHTVGGALVSPLILDGHLTFSGHGDAFFSPAPNSLASILLLGLVGLVLLRRATAERESRST